MDETKGIFRPVVFLDLGSNFLSQECLYWLSDEVHTGIQEICRGHNKNVKFADNISDRGTRIYLGEIWCLIVEKVSGLQVSGKNGHLVAWTSQKVVQLIQKLMSSCNTETIKKVGRDGWMWLEFFLNWANTLMVYLKYP